MRILFQGDSITCTKRNFEDPTDLGHGYVQKVDQYLRTFCAHKDITIINRGIGGDTSADLLTRWQTDCLDLQPDLLSLLVGLNDTGRRYKRDQPTSTEQFAQNYEQLMQQVKNRFPNLPIILMVPFLFEIQEGHELWFEDLWSKQHVVREMARKYGAHLICTDAILAKAAVMHAPAELLPDGVHPSDLGYAILAQTWLETALPIIG